MFEQFDLSKPLFTRGRTLTRDGKGVFLTGGTAIRLFEERSFIRASLAIKDAGTVKHFAVDLPPEFSRPEGLVRQATLKNGLFPNYPVEALRLHAPIEFRKTHFAIPREYLSMPKYNGHFLLMSVVCAQLDQLRELPKMQGMQLVLKKETKSVSIAYNGKVVMHIAIEKKHLQFGNLTFNSSSQLFEFFVQSAVEGPITTPSGTRMTPLLTPDNFYPVTHGLYTACALLAQERAEKIGPYVQDRGEYSFKCLNEAARKIRHNSEDGAEFEFE